MSTVSEYACKARSASLAMNAYHTDVKNRALEAIAIALFENRERILIENAKDMADAEANKLAMPLCKRLLFDEKKIEAVIEGIRSLISLEDPSGKVLLATEMDEGLSLYRISCPIGVIGIIFESRPDALVQIATLCLKAGNAVLLKGGSEAVHTNRILTEIIAESSIRAGMPDGWISLLESRSDVTEMLSYDKLIDLIIPRGSNEFVQYIMQNTSIPVLGHADGVCHVYVHEKADVDMAERIIIDSKTQYVAVCNAAETLVIDESIASSVLPRLAKALEAKNVRLYGCEKARAIYPMGEVAQWHHEYLDYEMSVHVVTGFREAVLHINTYGSGHTESIITSDKSVAEDFMREVDAGNTFWNCSTRFSDGYKYGFGAEVGISTSKIHARGPVGLEGLVTYKYKLYGSGQIVADYASGEKKFTHRPIDQN